MRTRQESSTLAEMLNLLPVPKHNFKSFSTVEERACKWLISTIFGGYAYHFYPSRAYVFCSVNGAWKRGPLFLFRFFKFFKRQILLPAGFISHLYFFVINARSFPHLG